MFSKFRQFRATQNGKTHNFRTLYIWLLSYLLVCAILTCCSIYLYTSLIRSTQEYVNQTHNEALNKIVTNMDHHMELASRFQASIATNEYVKQLAFTDMNDENRAQSSIQLGGNLGNLLSTTDFSGLYIYFTDKDWVVSNMQADTSRNFYPYHFKNSDIHYEDWVAMMKTPNLRNYMIFHKDQRSYLDIMFQLPQYDSHSYVYATLVARMDDSILKSQLSSGHTSSNIVILDSSDRVVMRSSDSIGDLHYEDFTDGEIVTDKEMTTLCRVSPYNNWKYLYISDNSEYYVTVTRTRTICIAFILFSLLFCCALGVIFSIYNYKPLNKLIKIYKKQMGEESSNNDYAIINDALQDYIESKRNLNSLEVREQNQRLISYLTGLLKGSPSLEENPPVHFPSQLFSVILFKPYNNQNLFGEETLEHDEIANTTFFILQNIMEELLSVNGDVCYVTQVDDLIAGICCYKNMQNAQVYKATLHSAVSQGLSFVKTNFSFDCNTGISMVREGTQNLFWAYNEALLALRFHDGNSENFVFYDEIYRKNLNTEKQFYDSFETKTHHLTTAISNGDQKAALSVLDTIFQQCISSLDVQRSKILLFTLENAIINTINFKQGAKSPEMVHDVLQSINADNISETLTMLTQLVQRACETQSLDPKGNIPDTDGIDPAVKTTELVPQMIDYIRDQYANPALDAASIGEHFKRSSYYISKVFKAATGESPTSYIARLRVENAKSLLRNTELSLSDIYMQSGFTNEKTFGRTFSKFEGLTPAKYRKIYQDNES